MAYTVTRSQFSLGNKRGVGLAITADAVSGTVDSGLSVIESISEAPKSVTSTVKLSKNVSAGVAANGKLNITAATSGDEIEVLCIGR